MPTTLTFPQGNPGSETATAADIPLYSRVKKNSAGLVLVCAITDIGVGVNVVPIPASTIGLVNYDNGSSVQPGIATEAIAVADPVYSAAAGQVSKTSGGSAVQLGVARTAASGAGVAFTYFRTV